MKAKRERTYNKIKGKIKIEKDRSKMKKIEKRKK